MLEINGSTTVFVTERQWNRFKRGLFTVEEQCELEVRVAGHYFCPAGMTVDTTTLDPKLNEKLREAVDRNYKSTILVTRVQWPEIMRLFNDDEINCLRDCHVGETEEGAFINTAGLSDSLRERFAQAIWDLGKPPMEIIKESAKENLEKL